MYTLYFAQGACSFATQVVLRELNQAVTLVDVKQLDDFKIINPVGAVPVLIDAGKTLTEGAAIMLHVLTKHKNSMFAQHEEGRAQAIQNIMFANATMHPAYSRLFFIADTIKDEKSKQYAFNAAADILLAVYARWGAYFPVDIRIGKKTLTMLEAVQSLPNFIKTEQAEQAISAA